MANSFIRELFSSTVTRVDRGPGRGGLVIIELHAEPAVQALKKFSFAMLDFVGANRKIATQLYGWVIRNFNSGGRSQDPPWAPLAPGTRVQKARLGYSLNPLVRTGHLRQSFAPIADAERAGVGARASVGVDYAAVHETGTADGKIPARPMLPPIDYARRVAVQIYSEQVRVARRGSGL